MIILGEIHGVRKNTTVVKQLVKLLNVDMVGFELETKWNFDLQNFRADRFYTKLKNEKWILNSGLMSKNHLTLIQWLRKQNKKIYAIRVEGKDWNATEKNTARYIDSILKNNPQKRMLIIIGNLHARKKKFSDHNEARRKYNYKPMRLFLKYDVYGILIKYGDGIANNFGSIMLHDKKVLKQLGSNKMKLQRSHTKYFDFELLVRK